MRRKQGKVAWQVELEGLSARVMQRLGLTERRGTGRIACVTFLQAGGVSVRLPSRRITGTSMTSGRPGLVSSTTSRFTAAQKSGRVNCDGRRVLFALNVLLGLMSSPSSAAAGWPFLAGGAAGRGR